MDWEAFREFVDPDHPDECHVVVPLRWGGRGKGSQTPFAEHEETWVLTLRAGRISRVTEYATKHAALEAVGLRE